MPEPAEPALSISIPTISSARSPPASPDPAGRPASADLHKLPDDLRVMVISKVPGNLPSDRGLLPAAPKIIKIVELILETV